MARSDVVLVQQEIAKFGALGAPAGLGLLLAAPTIATHGTQEQIDIHVRDIVTGQKAWCQLFSEPQAGSDLASLDAGRQGRRRVHHQRPEGLDLGWPIRRPRHALGPYRPRRPKHQGISYFAFDMLQDGVDVRPLKEMTGHALFNEVFITDARVADSALIGGLNNGWATANTTLMNERAGLGSGGSNAAGGGLAQPGTVMGMLSRRVGDLNAPSRHGGGKKKSQAPGGRTGRHAGWRRPAHQPGAITRGQPRRRHPPGPGPALHARRLGRFNGLRVKAAREQGRDIPGMPNVAKLSMSQIVRLTHDLGLQISGPAGTLHAYDSDDKAALKHATGDPFAGGITEMALFAQAPPIYGGTDQVQKNIIGERVRAAQGTQQRPRDPLLRTAKERLAVQAGSDRTGGWSE